MKNNQFLCFSILGLFLSLLGLFATGNSLIAWLFLALVLTLLFADILCRFTPTTIRELQESNCIRLDGSWSNRRESKERKSQNELCWNVWLAMALVTIPSLFGLWFINREVIPIGIGIDVATSFQPNEEAWKSDLHDEEQRFNRWHQKTDASRNTTAQQHKTAIWNGWPVLVIACCVWATGGLILVGRSYVYSLNKLRKSAIVRSDKYHWRDLSRVNPDDRRTCTDAFKC